MATKEYTLGRGKVYLARFKPGTQVPDGFRYIGNTPELSLTIESENLDHFSSDEGIREKDDSVPLEVSRSGSLTTDNIDPKNVALFFFGTDTVVTQAAVVSGAEVIEEIHAGYGYLLGQTDLNPTGYFGIDPTGFAIETVTGSVPLVGGGVDYTMDFDTGLLTFTEGSLVATEGIDVEVTFAVRGSTRSRVISGSTPVECALMYVTKNPKGANARFVMPYVKLTPNGDYALKGDDWQTIPLSLEVLKAEGKEAIYRDGTPVYA